MQVKLSRSGFPVFSEWHALIKDKCGTPRLGFPTTVVVLGQQLSTIAVLKCFVEGQESLREVTSEYSEDQLEEVCVLICLKLKHMDLCSDLS
jgi:hypothetical protein